MRKWRRRRKNRRGSRMRTGKKTGIRGRNGRGRSSTSTADEEVEEKKE